MTTNHVPLARGLFRHRPRSLAAAAFAAVFAAGPALAVDYTWNGGGGDINWSTGGNWIGGTAPISGTANNILFSGTVRLTPNQNLGTADFGSIQFIGSPTGNFTIGGNALRLGDYGGAITTVISNTVANANHTINNAIAFNETAPQISVGTSGTLTLGGLLTNGTGASTANVILANGTLLPTNSENSFSGIFNVRGNGTVIVSQMADGGSNSQIGAGSRITLGNGTADGTLRYIGPTVSTNRSFQFGSNTSAAGGATITADGTGPISFSSGTFNVSPGGGVDVTRIVTLSGTNTGDNTISGVIIDNNGSAPIALTKSGSGTWVLLGNNTYSGTTNLSSSGGTLVIGHGNALGGTTAGTIVANLAAVGLQGNITTAEPFTITGNGAGNTGSLYNVSGNNTISGPVTLAATAGVGATSGTLTLSNSVSGAFQLRKLQAGTVVLTGSNTYTGTTSVQGGTLVIGHANALGSTAVGTVVSNNMTLALQGSITTAAEPVQIQGTGVGGGGALVNLSGANTLSGPVTLAADTTVAATSGTLTLSNAVGGGFNLTKAGVGTVVLGGANTYTGDTIVSAGVLRLGANQATAATNSLTVSSGTLDTAGFTMSIASANLQGLTLGGGAAGSRAAVVTSSGTLAITSNQPEVEYLATNDPLGATIAGNLQLSSTGAATAFTVGDSTAAADDLTISAVIGGTLLTAYKQSAGTLVLSGQNTFSATAFQVREGTVILGTNAPASGPGSLGDNAADVQVGHLSTGGNASLLLQDGVTIARTVAIATNTSSPLGFTRTIGGVNTSGTSIFSGNVSVATNSLLSAAAGGTVVFSGRISDRTTDFQSAATIAKIGAGTVVLSGSNSTTLPWAVQAGKLLINGTNGGAGGTTVDAGALLGGSGRINGLVTVNGTLSPGNSPGVLTLSSLVLTSTATTLMEINDLTRGLDYDGITITSASGLTYGGSLSLAFGLAGAVPDQTTFDLFNFSGSPSGDFTSVTSTGFYAGTWSPVSSGTWSLESGGQTLTFSAATGDVVVVPEPSTLLLVACAAGIAAIAARRRVTRA